MTRTRPEAFLVKTSGAAAIDAIAVPPHSWIASDQSIVALAGSVNRRLLGVDDI